MPLNRKVSRVGFLGIIPQANAECCFPRVPSSNPQEFPAPAHTIPVFHLSTLLKLPGGTFAEVGFYRNIRERWQNEIPTDRREHA